MSIPKAPIANVTESPERKPNVDRARELPVFKPNVDRPDREQSYLWHWLGFHKWTKWSKPRERSSFSDALVGNRLWHQDRHCEVCNVYEVRTVREHNDNS